ncbi:MAG: hypothetical protein ACI9DK_001287 [Vicingaceae bacterium]|jgi:hypothetical protein
MKETLLQFALVRKAKGFFDFKILATLIQIALNSSFFTETILIRRLLSESFLSWYS